MYDVCRCNIPRHQGCAACGGAIPVSTMVTMARIEGTQMGRAEAMKEVYDALTGLDDLVGEFAAMELVSKLGRIR